MEIIKKKPEKALEELEAEADAIMSGKAPKTPGKLPAPPLKPGMMPPKQMPLAPSPKTGPAPKAEPKLSVAQVAKLPLFMKVEDYDRIVGDLTTLVSSLKKMESILEKVTALEEEETVETEKWRKQLNITKKQVRNLLGEMPETGRLREIMKKKGKSKKAEKIKAEVAGLKKELEEKKLKAPAKREIHPEVTELGNSIGALQEEMKHLHLELKMLNSLSQLKTAAKKKEAQTEKSAPAYKKSKPANPWK